MAESEEEPKSLLIKEKSEKAGLKLNIQKTKIMTSSLITSWRIDGEIIGNSDRLYFSWASKSLHLMSATIKLKDTCFLEEKL